MLIDAGPVRLNLSAMIQCFSLTTKQHQPAYQPQKRSDEQANSSRPSSGGDPLYLLGGEVYLGTSHNNLHNRAKLQL